MVPGPAFRRLLPIGLRAEGGPALRLLTYANLHFLLKLLVRRRRAHSFLKRGVCYHL